MALKKRPKPKEKKPKTSQVLDKKLRFLLRLDLKETERRLLLFIWFKQREAGGKWTTPIKIADICTEIGRAPSTVKDALKRLSQALNCIEKAQGQGRINKYRFVVPMVEIRKERIREVNLRK